MLTTNISNVSIPDANITHGYRLQDSALPALTFTVSNSGIASAYGSLMESALAINIIGTNTLSVLDLEPVVRAALYGGSYGRVIHAVTSIESTLSDPVIGSGDEQEPASLTINATLHWE